MIIYVMPNDKVGERLQAVLLRHIPRPFTILRTPQGKPYVEGDPIYFNYSHSGSTLAVAISDSPVGIDVEQLKGKLHANLVAKLTEEERGEVKSEQDFLTHWTVKEAFTKYHGGSIAAWYPHLVYKQNELYFKGEKISVPLHICPNERYVLSVCGEGTPTIVEEF